MISTSTAQTTTADVTTKVTAILPGQYVNANCQLLMLILVSVSLIQFSFDK